MIRTSWPAGTASDRGLVKHWLATVEEREAANDERRWTDPELVLLRERRATEKWPDLVERFAT